MEEKMIFEKVRKKKVCKDGAKSSSVRSVDCSTWQESSIIFSQGLNNYKDLVDAIVGIEFLKVRHSITKLVFTILSLFAFTFIWSFWHVSLALYMTWVILEL